MKNNQPEHFLPILLFAQLLDGFLKVGVKSQHLDDERHSHARSSSKSRRASNLLLESDPGR